MRRTRSFRSGPAHANRFVRSGVTSCCRLPAPACRKAERGAPRHSGPQIRGASSHEPYADSACFGFVFRRHGGKRANRQELPPVLVHQEPERQDTFEIDVDMGSADARCRSPRMPMGQKCVERHGSLWCRSGSLAHGPCIMNQRACHLDLKFGYGWK
jgi:hypothetical protein